MQICLIRHGSTAGNLEHRYVGTTDEGLTREAVQVIENSRKDYPQPDLIFASPMKRCVQTAELLYPKRPIEVVNDLRECEFGAFEYKNYKELQGDERYQAWIDSGGVLAFPGGESREEFGRRCCMGFTSACLKALQQNCACAAFVVHGGTIMAILDRMSVPHRDYFDWQVKNVEGFTGQLFASGKAEPETEVQFQIGNIRKLSVATKQQNALLSVQERD